MLTPDVIAKLKAGVANYDSQISNLKKEIDRARQVGIDTSALQSSVVNLENQVRNIKLQYAAELA